MRNAKGYIPCSIKRILNRALEISREEQAELVSLARKGDERAVERLSLANMKFITSRALYFTDTWNLSAFEYEDTLSTAIFAGLEGMYKAVEKFDASAGSFLTYARWYIDKYIRKALSDECGGISVGTVFALSLDEETGEDGINLLSVVADDGPSVEEIVSDNEMVRHLKREVAKLDARSRDILIGRLVGDKKYRDFYDKYGIGDERVRQILKETKKLLRYKLAG